MKDFQKLKVWEKAHYLTLTLYKETKSFPREELFGLTSQIRRASSSIPANLAEGCGRDSDKELARFIQIAQGSAYELEYHLLLSHELGYLTKPIYLNLKNQTLEIQKMLRSFRNKLINS
ncbi:MAG: four helix bundle protein [Xenococcaceae cyanobacterium MO_207.B15]|nr:four helix bundle protein [Xenococcaceae cyanobacterium MO_207.B15]